MKKVDRVQAEAFLKKQRVHRHIKRAIALLSAFVLLFTMNTLKRSANTLSRYPMCGYDEHIHGAECYDEEGNLICLIPEHVHTDACYQQAPDYVPEEVEQDLPTEDDESGEEEIPQDDFVDQDIPAEQQFYALQAPAMLSDIVAAMGMNVDLDDVLEVGAVVNDKAHEGLVSVARLEEGNDWQISALREFKDAELALVTADDILIIPLVDGVPEVAKVSVPASDGQTEVGNDETESGNEDGEQTEVSTTPGDEDADLVPTDVDNPAVEAPVDGENENEDVEVDLADVTEGDADATDDVHTETETENENDADLAGDAEADLAGDENTEGENIEAGAEGADLTDETEAASTDDANDDANIEEGQADDAEQAEDADAEKAEGEQAEDADAEQAEGEKAEADDAEKAEGEQAEDADAEKAEGEQAEADDAEKAEGEQAEDADAEKSEDEDEGEAIEDAEEGDETDEAEDAEDTEETEETDETEATDGAATEVAAPSVSVTVDLSSVDLMDAASVEADTVKLSVADLLTGADDAVNVDGDLVVDSETFADQADVTAAENVDVQDGMITLSAEALESGVVVLEITTVTQPEEQLEVQPEAQDAPEATSEGEADAEGEGEAEIEAEPAAPAEPIVTTQTVEIQLTGYTGRTTDEIASDPTVQIVPAEGNSLPADAYANVKQVDVPEELLPAEPQAAEDEPQQSEPQAGEPEQAEPEATEPEATEPEAGEPEQSEPQEGTLQDAVAYDITITNNNNDEISDTGAVTVTLFTPDLNVLEGLPEGAVVKDDGVRMQLFHVDDEGNATPVKDADFKTDDAGNVQRVIFETDGFSTYVIRYTVDFYFVDESGEEHFWQFPGTGSYALREVLVELGIDVEDKAITDPKLKLVEQIDEVGEKDLYLTQDEESGEWFINSDAAFDDTYELTVTVDQTVYTITVTDDYVEPQPWTGVINLHDYDGGDLSNSDGAYTNVQYRSYLVVALLKEKNTEAILGYTKAATNFNNGTTATFSMDLSTCKTLEYWERVENEWYTASGWNEGDYIAFDSSRMNVEFRIYEGASVYDNYTGILSHQDSITGFEIMAFPEGTKVSLDNRTVELNLRKAYDKTYRLRINVNPAGLKIEQRDGARYYAYIKMKHPARRAGDWLYAYVPIEISDDQTEVDFPITKWYDVNNNEYENLNYSGYELTTIQIYQKHSSDVYVNFNAIRNDSDPHSRTILEDGDSIGGYTYFASPIRVIENDDSTHTAQVSDVIYLSSQSNGTISKGYIDSYLQDATDFGYYTENYTGHAGDIEATVGAAHLSAVFEQDFGYSGSNVAVNRLKVLKVYTMADGTPVTNKKVTIRLYNAQTHALVGTLEGYPDQNGRLEREFDGLPSGSYYVSEQIDNGPEIFNNQTAHTSTDLDVTFSSTTATFVNNRNLNYFGTIDYTSNYDENVAKMLDKVSRVEAVILTDTEDNVQELRRVKRERITKSTDIQIFKNGTEGYKTYDIESDMVNLRRLSDELATATDSSTVRVINIKASQITEEGFRLNDDGRFIVINITMDKDTFCPTVRLDGVLLSADYGQTGNQNSSRVLYNLRGTDGHGYGYGMADSPEFNTSKEGAGIILAPWANAHILGGPFGGTIISKDVDRKGNELHSNNPNQIQKLNITIQNVIGTPHVGMLELRKAFDDPAIKDKNTYFKFKVTLKNNDLSKITKTFPVSGLKSGNTVTFTAVQGKTDEAEAYVLVQPSNSVTISNLPEGTTYEVEEIPTDGTSHYVFVRFSGDNTTGTGTIQAGHTAKVVVYNDLPKTGLKLEKRVIGTNDNTKDFHFRLYLWREDENDATVRTALTDSDLSGVKITAGPAMTFSTGTYEGKDATESTEFVLKKDEKVVIDGLPQGVHYAFVELNTSGKLPAGYVAQGGAYTVCGVLPTNNEAVITNTYSATGSVPFHAKKAANARLGTKTFSFQLLDSEQRVLRTVDGVQQDQTAHFTDITFAYNKDSGTYNYNVSTLPAEYTFYIKEVIPSDAVATTDSTIHYTDDNRNLYDWVLDDVIYDKEIKAITVKLKDDGEGNLVAVQNDGTTAMQPADLTQTFTNTHVPKTSVTVKKVWVGGDMQSAVLYLVRFKKDAPTTGEEALTDMATLVSNSSVAGVPSGYNLDRTWGESISLTRDDTTNEASQTVNNLLVYDENNDPYYYAIVEYNVPDGYTVTYKNGTGTATTTPTAIAATELASSETTLTATNTYTYTSAAPEARKLLNGKPFNGKLGDGATNAPSFTFNLKLVKKDGEAQEQDYNPVTITNTATVTFESILYTEQGTYIYEISEDCTNPSSIIRYDTTKKYWKVVVAQIEVDGVSKLAVTHKGYYSDISCDDQHRLPENEVPTFNNTEMTQIEILKKWSLNDGPRQADMPMGNVSSISVHLYRTKEHNEDTREIDQIHGVLEPSEHATNLYIVTKVPVKAANGVSTGEMHWYKKIENLDKYYFDEAQNKYCPYKYYVVEDTTQNLDGWIPTKYIFNGGEYDTASDAKTNSGEITIVNSKYTVSLPATGGVGTGWVYGAGAGLMLLAAFGWVLSAKKRRERE